jgi:23S rRNA pseudouridine955/2504/2580 synthase
MAAVAEAVIFEDKHFLVIDKPTGMASHGGSGVSHGAIELLRQARPKEHLELVHRLDRDTSGVLVFAKTRAGLTGLQAAIRANEVTKQYLCLMVGHPSKARFDVNVPLQKSILQGGERMVRVSEGGKPSLTFFHEMEQYSGARLMQATLGTGRTHQIRVHAAHIGHPLAGDPKYGDKEANKRFRKLGLHRLFLHASHMSFELDGRAYGFSAPLPDDLKTSSIPWRLKEEAGADFQRAHQSAHQSRLDQQRAGRMRQRDGQHAARTQETPRPPKFADEAQAASACR